MVLVSLLLSPPMLLVLVLVLAKRGPMVYEVFPIARAQPHR